MSAQLSQAPKRINPTSGQTGRAENQKHYAANYSTPANKYDVAPECVGLFNAYDCGKSEIDHLHDAVKRYSKNKLAFMAFAARDRRAAADSIASAEEWERLDAEGSGLLLLALNRIAALEGKRHV